MAKTTIIERLVTILDFEGRGLGKLKKIESRVGRIRKKLDSLAGGFMRIGIIASAPSCKNSSHCNHHLSGNAGSRSSYSGESRRTSKI